jgi:S-(hydroxymethyl)mycothiol dehydrogenase
MAYEVKGVIARSKGAPVSVETVLVPDPGPGEAVVDIQACGVCATDLHYREGNINDDYPFLLGHEAAGVVSAVGEGVTNVAVGDYVILNWRAVCGQCRACLKGQLQYCFDTHNAAQKMTLADGTELSPAWASARSWRRHWCTPGSAPRSTRRPRPPPPACWAAG